MEYPIPSWLAAANPAQHWAQGMALGLQGAQARASAALRAAELARQGEAQSSEMALRTQAQANQQAMAQAQMQLAQAAQAEKAQQAAQKLAAMNQYQQAVSSGMDPMNALIQFGPAMGQQGTAEAAVNRESAAARLKLSQEALAGVQKHREALEEAKQAELARRSALDQQNAFFAQSRQDEAQRKQDEVERRHKALEGMSKAKVTIKDKDGNTMITAPFGDPALDVFAKKMAPEPEPPGKISTFFKNLFSSSPSTPTQSAQQWASKVGATGPGVTPTGEPSTDISNIVVRKKPQSQDASETPDQDEEDTGN